MPNNEEDIFIQRRFKKMLLSLFTVCFLKIVYLLKELCQSNLLIYYYINHIL